MKNKTTCSRTDVATKPINWIAIGLGVLVLLMCTIFVYKEACEYLNIIGMRIEAAWGVFTGTTALNTIQNVYLGADTAMATLKDASELGCFLANQDESAIGICANMMIICAVFATNMVIVVFIFFELLRKLGSIIPKDWCSKKKQVKKKDESPHVEGG